MTTKLLRQASQLHPVYLAHLSEVRAHPNFDVAVNAGIQSYFERHAQWWGGKPTNRLGDHLVEFTIIYLEAEKELAGAGRGATIGALQLDNLLHEFASPRHVNSVVDRLVDQRRLIRKCGDDDLRVRRLIPTAAMFEAVRRAACNVVEQMPTVFPCTNFPRWIEESDRNVSIYSLIFNRKLRAGFHLLPAFPEYDFFFKRNAGVFIVKSLFAACIEHHGRIVADREFPVAYSAIAHGSGTSKSHVRQTIEQAAELELLNLKPAKLSHISLSECLVEGYQNLVACSLILYRQVELEVASFVPTQTLGQEA